MNYSIFKIIKNKIGYPTIFLLLGGIIMLFFTLLMMNDIVFKIKLLCISISVIILCTTMIVTNIIRINYFFTHGIDVDAFIFADNYHPNSKYRMLANTLVRWDRGDEKNGVKYRYKIESETYESTYRFIVNNETMFFKQGSVVKVLTNPNNKNDAIIKSLFIKQSE